jgi:hypothetical protein
LAIQWLFTRLLLVLAVFASANPNAPPHELYGFLLEQEGKAFDNALGDQDGWSPDALPIDTRRGAKNETG